MPIEKTIDGVPEDELRALISTSLKDAQSLEFRQALPPFTDAGRSEFLRDIASFANALGGHILYGVATRDGSPVELTGLEKNAVDSIAPWLEQAAGIGISPRIAGLRLKVIVLQNQKSVLVVRVLRSWAGPHMVTFQEENKFFSRNPAGRCLLAVEELRAAFALGESLGDKLRAFRMDRVSAILNRALSINLSTAPKTVLHILPVASFRSGFRVDLEQVAADETQTLRPMQARGLVSHYNYDGLMTFSSMEKLAFSYVQVFRNGCLEAAESLLLEPRDDRKFIPSVAFEREIIQCGNRLLGLLRGLHIDPPYVAMLSLLGVRDYGMFVGSMRWQSNAHHIERDHLFLDEVIINDPTRDFSHVIRPAFDQVWNACGWPKSANYDPAGNWQELAS